MRPKVFWGKYDSVCTHSTGIVPDDWDNFQGADRVDPLADGRIVADWGGGWAPVFLHAEKDVDARLDWEGRRGIWYEERDVLTLDGFLMIFQGEDNLIGVLEVLNWGVNWEEPVPDKENEFQERPELDFPVVDR